MTMYRFIDSEKANHAVRMICRVIRVSRAAYYAWRRAQAADVEAEARVRVHIRGLHRASRGTYGSPRVTAALRKQGVPVNHKRVARIMRAEGLQGLPRRRFRGSTTDSAHARPVSPNVLARDFSVQAPNVAWVGDITDRGAQYASAEFAEALQRAGIVQSMSRKGNCWDNAVAESFFGTLEQELGGRARWASVAQTGPPEIETGVACAAGPTGSRTLGHGAERQEH